MPTVSARLGAIALVIAALCPPQAAMAFGLRFGPFHLSLPVPHYRYHGRRIVRSEPAARMARTEPGEPAGPWRPPGPGTPCGPGGPERPWGPAGPAHAAVTGECEYLTCERCADYRAVAPTELDDVRALIEGRFGYRASFTHFPIVGLCASCATELDAHPRPFAAHP